MEDSWIVALDSRKTYAPVLLPARYTLTPSFILSWLGKEHSLVRRSSSITARFTDAVTQFDDHSRYRSHVRDWKCLDELFLF